MLTPKERDELLIARLGSILNTEGFGFRIGKTGLSWKNEHVSLRVQTRSNRYSTAECSIRWISIPILSSILREAESTGAPIFGSYCGPPHQLYKGEVRRPGEACSIQLELTDHTSIEASAREVADHFRAYWNDELTRWLEPSRTIDYLCGAANSKTIRVLLGPSAPNLGSFELDEVIERLVANNREARHDRLATTQHQTLLRWLDDIEDA